MPLTQKGEKIEKAMEREYGGKKGESVFYASRNKGTIKGVDAMTTAPNAAVPQGRHRAADDGSFSASDMWPGRRA